MALCEVAYADVLLELFDETAVLKPCWQFVNEKVYGVVARVAYHRAHYTACVAEVKQLLFVMIEIWETVRQCQAEEVCEADAPRSPPRPKPCPSPSRPVFWFAISFRMPHVPRRAATRRLSPFTSSTTSTPGPSSGISPLSSPQSSESGAIGGGGGGSGGGCSSRQHP